MIPSMNFLRDNAQLRRKVDTRIQQWEDQQKLDIQGKKLKSGLHRHQEGHVLVNVNWPHEFCFSQDRSCPTYDDLSQMQFTQGFIGCVLEESDVNVRQNMLEYLQQLIQDAQETNWFTAKSAHKVLLIEMERGKISWKDVRLIHQMRARYTQRTIYPGSGEKKLGKQAVPCKFFNKGNCIYENDHVEGQILQRHACAFCFKVVKRFCFHSETNCNRKQVSQKSKNDIQA